MKYPFGPRDYDRKFSKQEFLKKIKDAKILTYKDDIRIVPWEIRVILNGRGFCFKEENFIAFNIELTEYELIAMDS